MFTGNKNTDLLIFYKLNDKDICNMRLVSNYFNNIISDDYFWMNKLLFRYNISIDIFKKYRRTSWFKYYKKLYKIKDINADKYLLNGSRYGDLVAVMISLSCKVKQHIIDDGFRYSSKNGHIDIVRYLVDNGANIHDMDDYALRWAIQKGNVDIVHYLIENGAKINGLALNWAIEYGHLDILIYLIENGGNINKITDYYMNNAKKRCHYKVINYINNL